MTTIRVPRRRKFTVIDRATLNDASLSFRARGVLAWLLDKPDDWTTTADAIATHGLEGRDAIRAVLNELERSGYLIRRKWRAVENGQWKSEWTVMERPKGTEPERESSAGEPSTENQASLLNTELNTDLGDAFLESVENLRDEWAALADADCFECRGSGIAYHSGAGRDARCNCTRAYVKTERDLESETA